MCCGHGHGHGQSEKMGCTPHFRQFVSKKEKIKHLEKYKQHLQNEIEGVEEFIESLQKEKS